MSRKRKPQPKSIASATDAVFWRATILLEILDGIEASTESLLRAQEPMRRLQHALEDYEASRMPISAQGTLAL